MNTEMSQFIKAECDQLSVLSFKTLEAKNLIAQELARRGRAFFDRDEIFCGLETAPAFDRNVSLQERQRR